MPLAAPEPPPDRRRTPERRRLVGRRIIDLATHEAAWVTPDAVATYYGVSVKTVVQKWIACGLLKAHMFPGRHTRIEVRTLREFEARHRIAPSRPM